MMTSKKNRKLKTSVESSQDLRDLWGADREENPTPLKEFVDALDDPDYDPDDPEAVAEWRAQRYGKSVEGRIAEAMAKEIQAEIDAEIMDMLRRTL